jgi:Amino acid permease
MAALAFVFQTLALRKPGRDGGMYVYAKEGFGDYMGFSSAWGYWISAWLGKIGYFVLLFGTLGFFVRVFGEGNMPVAIVCASVLLFWEFTTNPARPSRVVCESHDDAGKDGAPLPFHRDLRDLIQLQHFTGDFWGPKNAKLGSVSSQVRNMMLVTVWVFIGVEGASIFSARGEKVRCRQSDRERLHWRAHAVGSRERPVARRHGATGTGVLEESVNGRRARGSRRALGRHTHQCRARGLTFRRPAFMAAALRGDRVLRRA